MTIIETAKMNGIDPRAYLADVLDRIHVHEINRLDELIPLELSACRGPLCRGWLMAKTTRVAPSTTSQKCSYAHAGGRPVLLS
jgi:hypothetical protein